MLRQNLRLLNAVAKAGAPQPKRVYVTGASGAVGKSVTLALKNAGYYVHHVSRWEGWYSEMTGAQEHNTWGDIEKYGFSQGTEAVIHLAGEPLSKPFNIGGVSLQDIALSRVQGLELIKGSLQKAHTPPLLITTSSEADWGKSVEACAEGAKDLGVQRVVHVRPGRVIGASTFTDSRIQAAKYFFGGGTGADAKQQVPWIGAGDLGRLYAHCISKSQISGPINAVSPTRATEGDIRNAIAAMVNRPSFLKFPSILGNFIFGGAPGPLFLQDSVSPSLALETGFLFEEDSLVSTLDKAKAQIEEDKGMIGHGDYAH